MLRGPRLAFGEGDRRSTDPAAIAAGGRVSATFGRRDGGREWLPAAAVGRLCLKPADDVSAVDLLDWRRTGHNHRAPASQSGDGSGMESPEPVSCMTLPISTTWLNTFNHNQGVMGRGGSVEES